MAAERAKKRQRPAEEPRQSARPTGCVSRSDLRFGQQKPPEAAGASAKETKRFYNPLGVDSPGLNFVSIPKDANAKEQSH